MDEGGKRDDNSQPYANRDPSLALFKRYNIAIVSRSQRNRDRQPAEREPDVLVDMRAIEGRRSSEELQESSGC